jgi:CDP-glycerol glycerophosphotransferase
MILMRLLKKDLTPMLKKIKQLSILKLAYKWLFLLIGLLPADRKLVVFESYLGKQYSCNPRAIYEYLREKHPDYQLYWSIDPRFAKAFAGKGLKTVNRFSFQWLFIMARARYWVSNSRLPLWIPKPAHTVYLQTWHGTPLKRLAADMEEVHMPGTDTHSYKKNFLAEAERWDYLVSPNRYSSDIFRSAFAFNKTMIESGYPRNDFLFHPDLSKIAIGIKERLSLPQNKKIVLYAPTWRDNEFYDRGKYKFNLELDLNRMREKLGDEYIVLLRMHYLIAENLDLSAYDGFALDVSTHEDIRELYVISDLLVTDYSSVFFDFGNLKRPMIFFVYDLESYRDNLRGFYFDFEREAPGPLVKTTDEVIMYIKEWDNGEVGLDENFTRFHERFCYLEDGEASERVVKKVFQ